MQMKMCSCDELIDFSGGTSPLPIKYISFISFVMFHSNLDLITIKLN